MILNPETCLFCSPEAEASVHRRDLTVFRLELQQCPPNFLAVPLSGQILAQQKARPPPPEFRMREHNEGRLGSRSGRREGSGRGAVQKLAHDPALVVGLGAVASGLGPTVVTFGSLLTDRSHRLKRSIDVPRLLSNYRNNYMKGLAVSLLVFVLGGNPALGDVLILRGGQVIFGTIQSQGADGYKFQRGTSTFSYPHATVTFSYQARPKDGLSAAASLPSWGEVVERAGSQTWGTSVKQIPATVVDKGIFRNVPYLSFRCGLDYEINVYGDPEQPSGIEIGCYRSLLQKAEAKENCVALIAELMRRDDLKEAVKNAKRNKDLLEIKEWTIEVSPPEGSDSYGGWWVSVYSEKVLNSQRASAQEMANVSVARSQLTDSADGTSGWSSQDLRFARPQVATAVARPVPPVRQVAPVMRSAPVPPASSSSGRVYVSGYTRKDGTYVHAHTRRR